MRDSNAEGGLLLGTVGWERPDWVDTYYPGDLPPEWRLAYYANDCGCVLVPASVWCRGENPDLEQGLEEAPPGLSLFLQAPADAPLPVASTLRLFAARRAVLLVERADSRYRDLPQWVAEGPDSWVDRDSAARLVRWSIDAVDLRDLRARGETLDREVRALVLDGPGADPGVISGLRTLFELMGRA